MSPRNKRGDKEEIYSVSYLFPRRSRIEEVGIGSSAGAAIVAQ